MFTWLSATATTASPWLGSRIPVDVWAETVLGMLDPHDMMMLNAAAMFPPLPFGATFVAKRVLQRFELEWLEARNIKVVLLSASYRIDSKEEMTTKLLENGYRGNISVVEFSIPLCMWTLNGLLHRDADLPALIFNHRTGTMKHWFQHGKRQRDGRGYDCEIEWIPFSFCTAPPPP